MSLHIMRNQLVIGDDPQTGSMARLRLRNGDKIIVQESEIKSTGHYGIFAIEQTLPARVLEKVEERRRALRNMQSECFDTAFSGDKRERARMLVRISLTEQRLHSPLLCATIRQRSSFSIWAPEVPEWVQGGLEVGFVTHIEIAS